VWPYSYNECDSGTLRQYFPPHLVGFRFQLTSLLPDSANQTYPNGTFPAAAKSSGSKDYGGELSWVSPDLVFERTRIETDFSACNSLSGNVPLLVLVPATLMSTLDLTSRLDEELPKVSLIPLAFSFPRGC